MRQPGGGSRGVTRHGHVVACCHHAGGARPERLPEGHDVPGPSPAHESLPLRRTGPAAHDGGTPGQMGAQQQDVSAVRVRGVGLAVQVVTVVPDAHQAEVGHGRVARGPGTHHHAHLSATHGQEPAVPFRRPQVGAQRDERPRTEPSPHRSRHPRQVTLVGYDQHRPLAGRQGGSSQLGPPGGPVLARRGCPHRPWGRAGSGTPTSQCRHQLGATLIGLPCGGIGRSNRRGRGGGRGGRLRGAHLCGLGLLGLLHPGVPRGHRQPQHVGHVAHPAVRHRSAQGCHLGRQDRLRAGHTYERGEPPGMVAGGPPLQDESVDQAAREAHAYPASGHRGAEHRVRDGIVEGPVEVRQRHVDQHCRHRQRGHLSRGGLPHGRHTPAADRSASTRSVRSHVKSGSSRPK